MSPQPKTRSLLRQSGVVPYRRKKGQIQVLLITTTSGGWGLPKGLIEPDYTPSGSAAKEAFEEAGAVGRAIEPAVGTYTYKKWGSTCRVKMFLMPNPDLQSDWPEAAQRQRKWFDLESAARRIRRPEQARLLEELRRSSKRWP